MNLAVRLRKALGFKWLPGMRVLLASGGAARILSTRPTNGLLAIREDDLYEYSEPKPIYDLSPEDLPDLDDAATRHILRDLVVQYYRYPIHPIIPDRLFSQHLSVTWVVYDITKTIIFGYGAVPEEAMISALELPRQEDVLKERT